MRLRELAAAVALLLSSGYSASGWIDAQAMRGASQVHSEDRRLDLPRVEVWIGMTTKEARAKSPEVLGRLSPGSGFDTWLSAYLNIPVRFIYRDELVGFTIDRPHAFAVSPNRKMMDGTVWAVTVELQPIFEGDIEGAIALAHRWCHFFESKRLAKPNYIGLSISAPTSSDMEIFKRVELRKGVGLCSWEKDEVIYSVGIERVERTNPAIEDKGRTRENAKQWGYKVMININHRSVFEDW
jgi:hypothetical protein